jgi:hypothetical protein
MCSVIRASSSLSEERQDRTGTAFQSGHVRHTLAENSQRKCPSNFSFRFSLYYYFVAAGAVMARQHAAACRSPPLRYGHRNCFPSRAPDRPRQAAAAATATSDFSRKNHKNTIDFLCSRAEQLRVLHVQGPPPLGLAARPARPTLPRNQNLHRELPHEQKQQPQLEQRQQQFVGLQFGRRAAAPAQHAPPPLAAAGPAQPLRRRRPPPAAAAAAEPRSSSSRSSVPTGAPLSHRSTS